MKKAIIIDSTLAQYTAEDISWLQKFFLEQGVLGNSSGALGLAVSQRGAGANLSVDVAVGNALIDFTKNSTNWKIIGLSNAIENVAVSSQSSGANRVGALIMRASVTTEPNVLKNNIITFEFIPGTSTSPLSDGAITTAISNDMFLRLADITVPTGAASIVTGNIADTRVQCKTNEAITLAPKNLKFTVQASDPASPVEGQIWYNSTTHTLNFYNNSTVKQLGGSSLFLSDDDLTVDGTDQIQTTQNASRAVGEANATTKNNKIAQSFTAGKTSITGVKLYKLANSGTNAGDVIVSLQADVSGSPSGSNLATVTIPAATYNALPVGEFTATFGSPYTGGIGTVYWIVISQSTSDNTNHANLGTNSAGGYAGGSMKFNNTTDGWTAIATIDLYFKTLMTTIGKGVKTNSSGKIDATLLDDGSLMSKIKPIAQITTPSRVLGTNYQNTTGKNLFVMVSVQVTRGGTAGSGTNNYGRATAYMDTTATPTVVVGFVESRQGATGANNEDFQIQTMMLTFVVPNNSYYRVTATGNVGTASLQTWTEQEL